MNSSDLGKIIKNARLSKKMTQNDVVGTFITRNMLTKLKSLALPAPSIKTLVFDKCAGSLLTLQLSDEPAMPQIDLLCKTKKGFC